MPDLITHSCVAYGLSVICRNDWHSPVVVGALMPDILSRVPSMVLSYSRTIYPSIPLWVVDIWGPLHLPVGMCISSAILAVCWTKALYARVFWLSLLGQFSHLLFDVGQAHITGGYALGFPFWNTPIELGWYSTEASVWIAPILLLFSVRHWKLQSERQGTDTNPA